MAKDGRRKVVVYKPNEQINMKKIMWAIVAKKSPEEIIEIHSTRYDARWEVRNGYNSDYKTVKVEISFKFVK